MCCIVVCVFGAVAFRVHHDLSVRFGRRSFYGELSIVMWPSIPVETVDQHLSRPISWLVWQGDAWYYSASPAGAW